MKPHHLLRLYPRAWRERYGEEFLALLADSAPGWREHTDIVRHAMGERVRDLIVTVVGRPSPRVALFWRGTGVLVAFLLLGVLIDASSQAAGRWLAGLDPEAATTTRRLAFVALLFGSVRLMATLFANFRRAQPPQPRTGVGLPETLVWCAVLFVYTSFAHATGTGDREALWSFLLYLGFVNRLSLRLARRAWLLRPDTRSLITLGLSRAADHERNLP